MFKLMQQHTNNWDARKLLSLSIGFPLVDVHPLGMDESTTYYVAIKVSM